MGNTSKIACNVGCEAHLMLPGFYFLREGTPLILVEGWAVFTYLARVYEVVGQVCDEQVTLRIQANTVRRAKTVWLTQVFATPLQQDIAAATQHADAPGNVTSTRP